MLMPTKTSNKAFIHKMASYYGVSKKQAVEEVLEQENDSLEVSFSDKMRFTYVVPIKDFSLPMVFNPAKFIASDIPDTYRKTRGLSTLVLHVIKTGEFWVVDSLNGTTGTGLTVYCVLPPGEWATWPDKIQFLLTPLKQYLDLPEPERESAD